jgi:ComEC/Rec2-related protein
MISRPLLGLGIAFLVGTWCGLKLDVPLVSVLRPALAAFALACAAALARRKLSGLGPAATALIHMACGLAAWAWVLVHPAGSGEGIERFFQDTNTVAQVRGVVAGDPDAGPRLTSGAYAWTFPFDVESVSRDGNSWAPLPGRARVTWFANWISGVPSYGETWQLSASAGRPDRRAIRLHGVNLKASRRDSRRLEEATPTGFVRQCYEARRSSLRHLAAGIADFPAEVGIYQSLILGYRWGLTKEAQEIFAATGTIHIFAISGSHVVIIAGLIIFLLRAVRLSRVYWVLALAPLLSAYTISVGGQSSAVRACLMAIIYFLAPLLRRRADVVSALAMAAILIVAVAPDQLMDVGFICSFVVVLGLIVLCPLLDPWMRSWAEVDPMRLQEENIGMRAGRYLLRVTLSLVAVSLAAWLTSAPLSAYYFGRFSLVSLPCNLFVIPMSFLLIVSGCLSLVLGPCWGFLGEVFNHASLFLVWMLERAMSLMLAIPGGHMRVAQPAAWMVWTWYALLAIAALWLRARRTSRPRAEDRELL